MKYLEAQAIFSAAKRLIYEANMILPEKILDIFQKQKDQENPESIAATTLDLLSQNAQKAKEAKIPLCQDTGTAVFFVEMGHRILLEEPLQKTLNRATAEGYREYFLRSSLVDDPLFSRKNTGDNTPAVVSIIITEGETMRLRFLPKGGGAENRSTLKMLRPADGVEGISQFLQETAKKAGGASCPPWIVGVGIGGTFDTVAGLAKKALLEPIGRKHPHSQYAELEERLHQEVESLNIGPLGFGGKKTIMALHIKTAPTHIASLPVAVNIQCHSARSAEIFL